MTPKWLFFALTLGLVLPLAFAEPDLSCKLPQPFSEIQLNPHQMRAMLGTSQKIKTIDEFICCLPESYRSNYIIGHSSTAAQSGSPDSPRVLMYNRFTGKVLSVNGGKPGQEQGDSVEFMYDNPNSHKLEYYDINFASGRAKFSKPNPNVCMACHGNGGEPFADGAKPLFEVGMEQWPAFVMKQLADHTCTDLSDEIKLHSLAMTKSIKAFAENPRFRCLKPFGNNGLVFKRDDHLSTGQVSEVDNMVSEIQGRRFVRFLRKHHDVTKFKFLWMGEMYGCFKEDSANQEKILSWIDKGGHDLFANDSYILSTVKDAASAMEACMETVSAIDKNRATTLRQITEELKKAESNLPFVMKFDRTIRACTMGSSTAEFCEDLIRSKRFDKEPWDLFAKIKLDTILNSPRRDLVVDPLRWTQRYIYEGGSGIEFAPWMLTPLGATYTRLGITTQARDSWLKNDPSFNGLNLYDRMRGNTSKPVACEDLRQLSLMATQGLRNPRGPDAIKKNPKGVAPGQKALKTGTKSR
jgi:hypothetical protein